MHLEIAVVNSSCVNINNILKIQNNRVFQKEELETFLVNLSNV